MTASVNGVFYHHNHHRIAVPAYHHHHQHHHPNMRAYDLSNDSTPVTGVGGGGVNGTIRMPDSPEAVLKNQSSNASSASSTTPAVASISVGPPLIHNNNHHKINSLSGLNGSHSPHSSTSSVGCGTPSLPTPPPPPSSATSSGHVTSVNSTSSSSSSCGVVTNNGSSLSAPALVNPEQLGNSVRQLSKLKRFLATLQQFGGDISPEVGERVHGLILGLVSSNLSIEEFHMKIQEVTNYPMRPFVIPLLKSHLPLLQAEVGHFARMAKQTPQQYVRQHEQALLELNQHIHHSNNGTTNFSASAVNSTSDLPSSAAERRDSFDNFSDSKDIGPSLKRRSVSDSRSKENGYSENSSDGHPPPKRHQGMTSPNGVMPGGSAGGGNSRIPSGGNHIPPVGFNFRFDDNSFYRERERYERYDRFERTLHRDFTDDREMEDEWKNIHTMLSCILGMVEKTKRALAILQHRSQSERQEMAFWNSAIGRRHLLTTPPSQLDGGDRGADFDVKKRDLIAHYKTAEDRVSEVRRRAEEAVNEVKRQAVAELQKAVSAAETKASELVATERAKMERLLGEARRQAAEEALATINQQDETTESCWNCGRKANETCSGCNVARYCGAFCQHKDWENHHRVCGQGTAALQVGSSTPAPGIAAPTTGPAGAVPGTNSINNSGAADSQGRLSPQSPSSVKRSPSPITISSAREKIAEKQH